MQLRKLFGIFTPIFIISLILMGCGGEKKTQEGEEDVAVKKEWTTLPTDTLTKEYLASVPPELGGEGFTGEGWQSNEDYESIADPKGVVGGQITLRMLDFPSTLRYYGKDSNSWINNLIAGLIYESLISIHSNTLEIVPGVATHWKMMMDTTNKEKPQTFWFRINPKAKWADGSPMTAYDVVATWRLLMDPSMLFPSAILTYGQYFEPVAESPYIVRVSTKELNWRLFLYIGGMNLHPEKYIGHLSEIGRAHV